MKFKILFLLIPILMIILSATEISLAEMPTPEKIQNFIPQPLTGLFRAFNNINIDFSKLPFFNRVAKGIPESGEEIGNSFRWLTNGLENINNWLKNHIGLDIVFIVKKTGGVFCLDFSGNRQFN